MRRTMSRGLALSLAIGAVVGVGLAFGCGGGSAHLLEAPAVARSSGAALHVAWSENTGTSVMLEHRPREVGGVSISSDGRTALVATSGGELIGFDSLDGTVRWRNRYGAALATRAAISGSEAFIGLPDGTIRSLDASSGRERWRYQAPCVFGGTPAVGENLVLVIGSNSVLYALDRHTGALAWRFERPRAGDLVVQGEGTPLITDDAIYAGFSDGSFARLTHQGALEWVTDLSNGRRRLVDVDATPLNIGTTIYTASFAGGLVALHSDDGRLIWRDEDMTGASSPLWLGSELFSVSDRGVARWYNPETGAVRRQLELERGGAGSPVLMGPYILVPSTQSGLFVIDREAAWIHSRFDGRAGFSTQPAVAGNRFFAISERGFVYGVDVYSL